MMFELRDLGFSTAIGIGGDPIIGTTHIDALEAFEADPDTKAIVMIGEIGGDAEERAAAYIKDHVTKPVVGYVAGFTAPEGKTMGHAGAIVSGSSGTAAGEEGGPRGRRRQGRQDPVGDRPADAGPAADVTGDGPRGLVARIVPTVWHVPGWLGGANDRDYPPSPRRAQGCSVAAVGAGVSAGCPR